MSKKIYAGMIQSQIKEIEKEKKIPPEKQIGYIGNYSYQYDDDGVVRMPNLKPILITNPNQSFQTIAKLIASYLISEKEKYDH